MNEEIKDLIICRCSDVRVIDVLTFFREYPKMPKNQMRQALNIGMGCGCCRTNDCPVIDIKFEKLLEMI